MKIVIQLIISFLLSLGISNVSGYQPNESTLNVLYTVAGILFSVGSGLIITFVPNGVKNSKYIIEIRKTLNYVRNCFFIEFSIITILYVFFSVPSKTSIYIVNLYNETNLKIDLMLFTGIVLLISLPYFMINFLAIQKLNYDIFDRVTSENT